MSKDTIYRKDAIDVVDSETVSTNPDNFQSSEKFIMFMDDADIASFGKWQWANGFNTALVATKIQLEKLPSVQPDYQEVLGWLLAYHTKSFDLHGRYLPHEVISWLINDFTKNFIAERRK